MLVSRDSRVQDLEDIKECEKQKDVKLLIIPNIF